MTSGLVLRLRPNEKFLVNGVVLENGDRRTRLRVTSQNAKILRLRDALHPNDANTPTKRLYYIAQLAVAGEASVEDIKEELLSGLLKLRAAFGDEEGSKDIDMAIEAAKEERFYHVMRSLHRVIPHEVPLLMAVRPKGIEIAEINTR